MDRRIARDRRQGVCHAINAASLPARVLVPTVELVAAEPPLGVAIDPVEAPAPAAEPEEFAVPAVFVPGIVGTIAELPTPLGS
jgi:hypothetical protein